MPINMHSEERERKKKIGIGERDVLPHCRVSWETLSHQKEKVWTFLLHPFFLFPLKKKGDEEDIIIINAEGRLYTRGTEEQEKRRGKKKEWENEKRNTADRNLKNGL